MQDVVHTDSVRKSADLDQIVLCEAQQISTAKVSKRAHVAGQAVVVDPLRQMLGCCVLGHLNILLLIKENNLYPSINIIPLLLTIS